MHYIAPTVHPDEPAYGMSEKPVLLPGPNGAQRWRWVQRVFVIRGDTIAKHETDYGPAEDFEHVTPMIMPSHGENTVAQLREHFDKNREDRHWWNRRYEMLSASTLVSDILRQEEEIRARIKNKTTSGPYVTIERGGYSQEATQRKLKERQHAN